MFWLYSLGLSIHALFGTAVTFHIVAIFAEASRSRAEAFAYFIPQAVVSVVTNLSAIGPLMFSVAYDTSGTFAAGYMLCTVALTFVLFD